MCVAYVCVCVLELVCVYLYMGMCLIALLLLSSMMNKVEYIYIVDEPIIGTHPNFSKADWHSICYYLSTINWADEMSCCLAVENYWQTFLCIVFQYIDRFVPRLKITKHTALGTVYPKHIKPSV